MTVTPTTRESSTTLQSLTVGDVAAESGVATSAVRFYEKYGVIVATRTTANQRRFTDAASCRIKVAKLAQRVGLTVREIAAVFSDLPDNPTPKDWGNVAEVLIAEAEARTDELRNRLADMQNGTKLCEIVDHIDVNPRRDATAGSN